MLEPVFHDLILADQDCFATEEGWKALVQLVPDHAVSSSLRERWEEEPDKSSEDKWEDFLAEVNEKRGKSNRNIQVRAVIPVR